jgi:hypothetical protein
MIESIIQLTMINTIDHLTIQDAAHLADVLEYDFERFPLPICFDRASEISALYKRRLYIKSVLSRLAAIANARKRKWRSLEFMQSLREECGCGKCKKNFEGTEQLLSMMPEYQEYIKAKQ